MILLSTSNQWTFKHLSTGQLTIFPAHLTLSYLPTHDCHRNCYHLNFPSFLHSSRPSLLLPEAAASCPQRLLRPTSRVEVKLFERHLTFKQFEFTAKLTLQMSLRRRCWGSLVYRWERDQRGRRALRDLFVRRSSISLLHYIFVILISALWILKRKMDKITDTWKTIWMILQYFCIVIFIHA